MIKKLFLASTTLIITVLVSLTLALGINAASSTGITIVQEGMYHYIHFGNNTDSQHITDIADADSLYRGSGFNQLQTGNGTLYVDYPVGNSTFIIANASGQIIWSQSANRDFTDQVQFIYADGYLTTVTLENESFTWNLGYYGKFYFVNDKEPILNGQTAFVTTIDNPIPESTIRSYISAYDDVDGDITHLIQLVSSDYEAPFNVGEYEIEYSVSDSAGNVTTLLVYVLVRDITAPDTNADTFFEVSYTQTFDVAGHGATIKAEGNDNYYSPSQLTVTVVSNGYTPNKTTIGQYVITYSLKDPSGNERLIDVYVSVIDNVAPIVTYNPVIMKPATSNLILADIIADISATDVISGNVTSSLRVVTDGYTGNGNKVGEYDIVFEVKDGANNITSFTVRVKVLDNVPPVFMVIPGHFIRVEQIVTLTNEDIIDILTRTGQLQIAMPMSWSFITNEYLGNEEFPGLYAMSMRFVSTSGATEVESFVIEVLESTEWDGVVEDAEAWYVEALAWMQENPLYTVVIFLSVVIATIALTLTIHGVTSSNHESKYGSSKRYYRK